MNAKINFLNIGIVIALLVSGVAVAFHDSQNDKAAVASGINRVSSSVSAAMPVSSVQESMPEMSYNTMNNSINLTQGFTMGSIIAVVVSMFIVLFMTRGVCSYARM
jgi:hypothetical protein